jgi:molybdenum cofactor cytidylyltransferase
LSGRLFAVVLAAGLGRRFGGGKLTALWNGRPLIEGALAAALAAPVERVVVTLGADAGAVRAAAEAFAGERGEAGRLAFAPADRHEEGMAWSLRAGIAALPPDAAGAYLFLGDMPRVNPEVLRPLALALAAGAPAAVAAYQGRRGHPVLISAPLFSRIAEVTGDVGAKSVLDSLGGRLVLVPSPDDGVLFDVDRREDIEAVATKTDPPG